MTSRRGDIVKAFMLPCSVLGSSLKLHKVTGKRVSSQALPRDSAGKVIVSRGEGPLYKAFNSCLSAWHSLAVSKLFLAVVKQKRTSRMYGFILS